MSRQRRKSQKIAVLVKNVKSRDQDQRQKEVEQAFHTLKSASFPAAWQEECFVEVGFWQAGMEIGRSGRAKAGKNNPADESNPLATFCFTRHPNR
jgi:hypothetical protein